MKKYSIIRPDPTLKRNLMAFGFETGTGWYPLIFETLDAIQTIVDREGLEDFEITQVKEKFGGLRIYTSHYIEKIESIIDYAAEKSYSICELCGEAGETRDINGWLTTLCDGCAEDKQMEGRWYGG